MRKATAAKIDRDTLIASVVTRCIDRGIPPSEVVTAKFLAGLPESLVVDLARTGLVRDANDELHRMRGPGERTSPRRSPLHTSHGRGAPAWKALGLLHVGADGMLKPLLEFGVADAEKLMADSDSMRAAWRRRKWWAGEVVAALAEHGAEVLQALPPREVERLDDAANKAWA